jgi:hypothetical protein
MTPAGLLDLWEQAAVLSPGARAVVLAAASYPDLDEAEVASLPLGARDASLLHMHSTLFGGTCSCLTECPSCGAALEFELPIGELLAGGQSAPPSISVELAGQLNQLRLPTSEDLVALADIDDEATFRDALIDRCMLDHEGWGEGTRSLGPDDYERLAEALEAADPLAITWVELRCTQCAQGWKSQFDIAPALWSELERWALALLDEVACLARAFGWTERDILSMSAARRHRYLELATS